MYVVFAFLLFNTALGLKNIGPYQGSNLYRAEVFKKILVNKTNASHSPKCKWKYIYKLNKQYRLLKSNVVFFACVCLLMFCNERKENAV